MKVTDAQFLLTMDGEQTLATVGGYMICLNGLLHDFYGNVDAEVDCNGLLMISWTDKRVRHLHVIDADHWVVEHIVDTIFR